MKEKFMQIPQTLRKQIWLRCGGAGMGAAMLLMVLIYSTDWRFMVPCAVAAVLCLVSAALLYYRCIQGRYVEICGICTEIERSGIRKRIKAIYLQTSEYTIRVVGIKPIRNLSVGDTLTLYVADNTAVYSMDGCSVICSYIAMVKTLPTQKKEIQTQ